jgi:hypothetical protein
MIHDLDTAKRLIGEAYERNSIIKKLVDPLFVHDVIDPVTELPKISGPLGGFGAAQPLQITATPSSQNVTPENIGSNFDISRWHDKSAENYYFDRIGRFLAGNEIVVLRNALLKGAASRAKARTRGILAYADIVAASEAIDPMYESDRLLIHPEQKRQLALELPFYMNALSSITEGHVHKYASQIHGLDVYWDISLEGTALVYGSLEVTFCRPKVKIWTKESDVPSKTKELVIDCRCSCAPVNERSVAVIEL